MAASLLVASSSPSFGAEDRPADSAGSAPVGSTSYSPPAGAYYVASSGSDAAPGSATRPLRSIGRAIALAPSGSTIVVRRGVYHESLKIWDKKVTIQSYPGEAVWLDGSSPVSGWVADGAVWRHDGWSPRFDHSPTFTKGVPDYSASGMRFLNPAFPMAAHPDQLFIDGVAQQQVASRSLVRPGTFYLDESTSRLYVGSNPSGHATNASTLAKAIGIQGGGSVIRGIGIRRYATSVWMMGTVTVERPGVSLENVVVEDSATTGIGVFADDVELRGLTVKGSGLLGVNATGAYNLVLDRIRSSGNNDERFNQSPTAGGAKVCRTRNLTVRNSVFQSNYGAGFWTDQSVYNIKFVGNNVVGNAGAGLFLEISALATVADNLITQNQKDGVEVNNTSDVQIINNTIIANGRSLNIVQDSRTPTNTSYGQDTRRPFPDPTMPWRLGPVLVRNNVLGAQRSANCVLCVEDYTHVRTAAQIGVSSDGNIYSRASASAPTWLVVWSRGSVNINPNVLVSLSAFQALSGQEAHSREFIGTSVAALDGTLASGVRAMEPGVAQGVPASVLTLVGRPAGTRHLGVWGR